jgi:hypothetical protein
MRWQDIATSAIGDLIGGLVAGLILLWLVRRFLDIPARERQRAERTAVYLDQMRRELEANETMRANARAALEEPGTVAWPLFETFGADILRTPEALEALEPALLDDLLGVYNRMRSANELTDEYRATISGPQVALIIGYANPPVLPPAFLAAQEELRQRLADRLDELAPRLAAVVAALQRKA